MVGVWRVLDSSPPWEGRHDADEVLNYLKGRARTHYIMSGEPHSVDLQGGNLLIVPARIEHQHEMLKERHVFFFSPSCRGLAY